MRKIILGILFVFLSSCKFLGTSVGNPMNQNTDADCDGKRCMPAPMVQMLSSQICEKVETCGGATYTQCSDAYRVEPGLNSVLGLGSDIDTFESFERAYNDKELLVDNDKYGLCMKSLQDLSCDAEGFKSVYDIGTPSDFSALHKILEIDQNCLESFTRKQE